MQRSLYDLKPWIFFCMKRIGRLLMNSIVIAISFPVITIWMAVGACIYNATELFRYLLGKSPEEYHEPNATCTHKNRCTECRRAKKNIIFLGCSSIGFIAILFFVFLRLIMVLGIIPLALIVLVFFGVSRFVLKDLSGKV